jgi:uncharacterized repeat protein (TIGR01451 family)
MKKSTFIIIFLLLMLKTSTIFGVITISLTPINSACGNNNGKITSMIWGATMPYNYIWSNGQTSSDVSNLAPGVYTVTVTDALGSTNSSNATIIDTPEITGANLSYVVPTPGTGISHPCNNLCNGVAYLSVSSMSGTPPFSLGTSLSHNIGFNAQASCPTVEGICTNDNYTIFVSDALGCTGTGFGTFSYLPNDFSYTATVTPACNSVNNGLIQLDFTNTQNIPYTANWSGPSTGTISNFQYSVSIPALLPGNYNIQISNDYAVGVCDTNISVTVPNLGFNCGTVSGQLYMDSTTNCIHDFGEPLIPSRIIRFLPGPYYSTTDNTGNYVAFLPYGTYTAETINDYNFTNTCPASGISISVLNPNITGVDIGDSTTNDLDLSMHLSALAARPGFNYRLYATVINHSFIAAMNPEVVINFDPILTLLSATIPYTVTGPSQITIAFASIGSFSSASEYFTFTIPADPLLIGAYLNNNAAVNANQPETNTSNNSDYLQQIISGSYDPNDKTVWPALDANHTYLVDVDTMFRYTIRFQNSGTDTAFNIVLVDTLSPYLDITTFKMLGTSHNCRWEITGQNILKVYYENILLPDSNVNEPGSHGLFIFSINPTPDLNFVLFPYILENTAAIYFDFNPPIFTNTEFNTIDISVGVSEITSAGFGIYPNPANESIVISGRKQLLINKIELLDLTGRLLFQTNPYSNTSRIDVSKLMAGTYLVVCYDDEGIARRHFIKY